MSSIGELTIKGVRSFSHEEEQTLKFLRPLTVITGHNGAGKTTIIECLRYVCSGVFPPGAQNSCFVRDLKKAGISEVTGLVDLKFQDATSKKIQVTRRFKAFRKKNSKYIQKVEFQSLPPEISSKDGKVVTSRTQKQKDLNEEMVDALGVSQTIMVNVIFCHQDESNWPLSDGKHLKEKFDEIFGATRYIKALDSIKKLQKEQNETIKLLQKDAENYEEWIKEAKQENENLEMKQAELDVAKTQVLESSILLEPKLKKLKEIEGREHYLQELKTQIRELNAKKGAMESSCQELRDYCKNNNEEELSSVIERKKKIKAKKDDEYKQLLQVHSRLKQNERDLEIEQGKLKQEEKDFESLKCRLRRSVEGMICAVPGCQSEIDWNDESSLKEDLEVFQEKSQEEKRQMETQLDNVRKKIFEVIHHESADVVFLEKEIQKLEMAKSDIMCRRSQEVVQLFGEQSENDWFRLLDDFHRGQKANIQHTRERLHSKKMEKCRQESMEKQILDKLERKEKKLKDLEKQLKEECGNQEEEAVPLKQGFQGLIQLQQSSFSKVKNRIFQQGSSAHLSYSTTVFPTIKLDDLPSLTFQRAKGNSPAPTFPSPDLKCPLCNQNIMGNESEKQTILQIMKEKLPTKLKDTPMGEEQLLQEWGNVFKMHRTTFLKEKVAKLTDRVIPGLKTELEPVQDKLRKLESDIREEEETLRQLQDKENLAAKLIPDVSILNYLIKDISKCTNEIESFKRQQKSAKAQRKLEHSQMQLEHKIRSITQGLVTLENYVKDLDRFTSLRENLDKNERMLQKLRKVIASEGEKMDELYLVIKKFEKSIHNNKDKLTKLGEYKSRLEGKQADIEKVEQQLYTAMEDQQQAMDFLPSEQTKEELEQEISELQTRKLEANGSLNVLSKDICKLELKLSQERYLKVDDKHRDCVINLRTTEIANKDLKKYYHALDWAIIQFHKIKMEEINRIANKYWTKIYKGNDIDFIKILSETSSSETSARRSYNYRVVMISDGVEMDMRGRCSAGQKVLASLIIRLALAETFCLSCGILALDEPTTNLDYENKQGLASALTEIIEEKIKYKDTNFQLIIITHDETFVNMLESSGYADYFYRVTRDDNSGNSVINCKNISDLQR